MVVRQLILMEQSATYAWTKTSGPASYTIANAGMLQQRFTNLAQGVYVFTLQVTDNAGATASSTVTVTVNAAPAPPPAPNQAPVANAGSNINITLPANNTTLDGSASNDPDGTISTYAWMKTSGPAAYTYSKRRSSNYSVNQSCTGRICIYVTGY